MCHFYLHNLLILLNPPTPNLPFVNIVVWVGTSDCQLITGLQ